MIARLTRIAISFLAVLATYFLYALLAVPWIEPAAEAQSGEHSSRRDREAARNRPDRYTELLSSYFPEGHWALDKAKVLESPQAMLLLKEYHPESDGHVKLVPCAMIFFPEPRDPSEPPPRRAIILEAPGGALLKFDEGFNLVRGRVGKLDRGRIAGEITIRSDMDEPGPQDDLRIVTRDVQLSESRIWTDERVTFQLGRSHGEGNEMEIRLLPASTDGVLQDDTPNVGGIQWFELARNVKVHLEMQGGGLLPGRDQAEQTAATSKSRDGQTPVEVTCQGPFHFDVVDRVATFEDKVDVLRLNPQGQSDQMSCHLLSIYFENKEDAVAPKPTDPQSDLAGEPPRSLPALRPRLLEAEGDPVVVRSPSTGGNARCQHLRYDLTTREIALDGTDPVTLHQGPNEIHARKLKYRESKTPGGLGMLWAEGPGFLRAAPDEQKPGELFQARWSEELHLRRHEGKQLISLVGQPTLEMAGMGSLAAEEFHLWLTETPNNEPVGEPDQRRLQVLPDRMSAAGKVEVRSPQLSGHVERLEVWFDQDDLPTEADTRTSGSPERRRTGPARSRSRSMFSKVPKQTYDIAGRLLQVQLATHNGKTEVADLAVEGNVRFREMETAHPEEKPLVVEGDRLNVAEANLPSTQVTVLGGAGRVEARGLRLTSNDIHLNRGSGRLWCEAAGTMTLPMRRDLAGRPIAKQPTAGQPELTVSWLQEMRFDGQTMRFERSVRARSQQNELQTESLAVTLNKRIRFDQSADREGIDWEQMECKGDVMLESRVTDEQGRPTHELMSAKNLLMVQSSGEIRADGPGWIKSWHYGGGQALAAPGAAGPTASAGPAAAGLTASAGNEADREKLHFLQVDFQDGIDGNMHQQELTFLGQVSTVYGPVATWKTEIDADSPAGLGLEGMMLSSEQLTVADMNFRPGASRQIEFKAIGGVVAEGRTFTARAELMKYSQAKDLIILEGTGRSDAMLSREVQPGAPSQDAYARKIHYWRRTGKVKVDGARFIGGSQAGAGGTR